jgi:hypothetical protein
MPLVPIISNDDMPVGSIKFVVGTNLYQGYVKVFRISQAVNEMMEVELSMVAKVIGPYRMFEGSIIAFPEGQEPLILFGSKDK